MERVQFQQEQMLAELKDLVQKGLFTQQEIKQIMKKRTIFETALVRRVAKKNDYLRYAAYEMGLETLRKKRAERLKLPQGSPSVSDYALVRRQFHIFERALKKFKSDVGLWIQYIQLAKKEGARSLVGRISARALQLHPNVPSLYIIAAQHELSHLSPSAARVLLQRGIRLNAESVEMWTEYVKFELGFVESMRRRWDVLGIKFNEKGKEKAQVDSEEGMDEGEVEQMQTEADGDDGEQARQAIMQGAIVKSVIANAVKALPKPALFVSLHELLSSYPTTPVLRTTLLDHLHTLLLQTLPTDPIAVKLTATRHLLPTLGAEDLVDALKDANEKMVTAVQSACTGTEDGEGMAQAYASFVSEWVQRDDLDVSLKAYLITSLHMLIQRLAKSHASNTPAPLLATEITLLTTNPSLHPLLPFVKNVTQLASKYTSLPKGRPDARVWLARLEAENSFSPSTLAKTLTEARANVHGADTLAIWLWGVDAEADTDRTLAVLETLLAESMRMQDAPSFRAVHDALLARHAGTTARLPSPTTRLASFRRISANCLPGAEAYRAFFAGEATADEPGAEMLREVYTAWARRAPVDAALAWAGWLLEDGQGREAGDLIQRARGAAEGVERQRLEEGWRRVVGAAGQPVSEDAMEED